MTDRPASGDLPAWPPYSLKILSVRNGLSREALALLRREKVTGTTFHDCLYAVEAKLTSAQIEVNRSILYNWALDYWKADKRNKFVDRTPAAVQAKERWQTERCMWVVPFWTSWNLGLSGTVTDDQAIAHHWACIRMATSLIEHPQYGNPEWAITFRQLTSNLYRPERVNSVETARVYTWLLHNATRRGRKARPWPEVAREWNWSSISTNRLVELVKHCGGNPNSTLDPNLVP